MVGLGLGFGLGLGSHSRPKSDEDEMPRRYMFVDGAFLRGFINEMRSQAEKEYGAVKVNYQRIAGSSDRILFYDAYPERKPSQSDADFQKEMIDTEDFFQHLSELSNFNVRPALTKRGKKREQKGVDVLLAIECLMHSIRGNIDEATIVTSDLDFFPLFEALLQTKTRSLLRYQIERTSSELISVADRSDPLTAYDFFGWLDNGHSILHVEDIGNSDYQNLQLVRSGVNKNVEVSLMRHQNREIYCMYRDGKHASNFARLPMICIGEFEKRHRSKILWTSA